MILQTTDDIIRYHLAVLRLHIFRRKEWVILKPIIGVMPLWDDEKQSIWMLPGYMDGIQQAGGIPIVLPFSAGEAELKQLAQMCDGFLFTGGHDVSPEVYHEQPLEGLVSCCKKRDAMEGILLRAAVESDKAVLGICRGLQFINAALGETLYQDIPTQHPSAVAHHQQPPYHLPSHEVAVAKDSPLHKCLKVESLPVNSCHHQAIKALAPGLESMAAAPDGLVEAVYMPGHRFVWAVQWHPEFSGQTEASRRIFSAFVDAM